MTDGRRAPIADTHNDGRRRLVDVSEAPRPGPDQWLPVVFTAAEIETEIDRLAAGARPVDGRRAALFVHPSSREPGLGLAPGIRVTLSVLLPGERTLAIRHNSTLIDFCIRGSGRAVIGEQRIRFSQFDVWNTPSYTVYSYENDGSEVQVRLTYSDAPLLEKLGVHIVDQSPPREPTIEASTGDRRAEAHSASAFRVLDVGTDGAKLMPYELLINPPVVDSPALHWSWKDVRARLEELEALGADYAGRRLYLLYNPMTGRTNGTTSSFFATLTLRPPGIVDRPHRHVSTAINYFFEGSGYSRVGGTLYHWSAGDLMLTAPGWTIHNHASDESCVFELTIQDQPLNIAMESLLWQEDLKQPPVLLGFQPGFMTNRVELST